MFDLLFRFLMWLGVKLNSWELYRFAERKRMKWYEDREPMPAPEDLIPF